MNPSSTLPRETRYDEIFDAQKHFRTLLDSMSRPGKLNSFSPVAINPPRELHRGAAFVALALLNADATFASHSLGETTTQYLVANTQARSVAHEQADYLFTSGASSATVGIIHSAKLGLPTYPETNATVVIQVEKMSKSSHVGGVQLQLEGPGIERQENVFIQGLRPEVIDALKSMNREFPLGVDAIVVSEDESVLCLPRTSRITLSLN